MDTQKEIEKMAKALYGHYCGEDKCGECKQPRCADYIRAERLTNAGYGDVKQAVREFAEKVKEDLEEIFDLAVKKNWGSAYEYIRTRQGGMRRMKIYKQIMNEPQYVADILNALQKDGKEIAYVIPCHEYDGTLVVIVYREEVSNE